MTARTRVDRQIAGLCVTDWEGGGVGAAVVGLAGLGSSGGTWGWLARSVPGHRVVGPHLRGRGGSAGAGGPAGLRGHARDVARVLDELDLREVVVVGHSLGAYLAPLVAEEAPDRVARLVLVDGGLPPQLPRLLGPRLARLAFLRDLRQLDHEWPSVEAAAGKRLEPLLRDRPDLRAEVLEVLAEDLSGPTGALRPRRDSALCAADGVDAFFGGDATAALEALEVPAHLVVAAHGKHDGAKPFLSDAVVERWTSRLPSLTAERVQANHATVLFAPELVRAVHRPPGV